MTLLFTTIIVFFSSVILSGMAGKYLIQYFPDVPNERSSHTKIRFRGGSIAILISLLLGLLTYHLLKRDPGTFINAPIQGAVLIGLIGLLEDRSKLSILFRLFAQFSASFLLLYQSPLHLYLSALEPFSGLVLSCLLLAGVAIINFYNFMDGIDGLVAGTAILQLTFLAILFHLPIPLILAAAVLGFLFWNFSPNKIFLGDGGSYLIGGYMVLRLGQAKNVHELGAILLILAPILLDAVYTLSKRLLAGKNIFKAHREHVYQQLAVRFQSHTIVTLLYMLTSALIGICLLLYYPL